MKTRTFRSAISISLMLILILALALAANAQPAQARLEESSRLRGGEPMLTIAYKNLSYSSDLYVMYAVDCQNVPANASDGIQMLFWDDDTRPNGYEKGSELYAVTEFRVEQIYGTNYLVFYSHGVAPKELTKTQYCCAYVQVNGVDYYSEVIKYNPLSYIKTISEDTTKSEADRNLVDALAAYGAAAQIRFAYNTSDLATDTHYEITLQSALLEDGFSYGLYKEGTQLTLTAEIPSGDSVARWVDGNGVITGSEGQASITYTLNADSAVRAVLASEPDSCDHVYSAWIPAADASCTEAGAVGHYHCDLCGRNFDAQYNVIDVPVVIPALGHEWVDVAAVPATCVPGYTAYRYCNRCGLEDGKQEIAATDPHDYVESVVAPSGETRGYTDHVCSVCGDSYKTDYDYSLYSGVNFADEGKFSIPYNFDNSVYTFEVSLQLPTTQVSRAGVLLGNYINDRTLGFTFEIYSYGRPRLYFVANAAGTTTKTTYNYIFNTDVRGEDVKNIAVVLADGNAVLYVDGVLTETIALGNFEMPEIGRSMVLGGDNRSGNSQGFKGTIYSATIFRDARTEEEIVNDLVLADATDQNCCVSYNLLDSSGLTGSVSLENILDNAQVTTAEELAYHASHGTRNIEVMNDITIDRTIYVISDVTIFSNGNYTLLRDPNFYSDMFVIGENAAGRNLILDNITCVLNLGKAGATGTLTVDGNKTNVTGDVYGSLVYINNSGTLNLRDGGVLTNNKKVGNSRSLGMEQYYANMIGGAAIVNINGKVNMSGGVISYNEVNATDPGSGDSTNEHYLESCYGGAVFNNSNFVMTGGTINDNYGYYGGAISNFQECTLEGGLVEANHTTHAGGAIYMLNNYMRTLTIGKENAAANSIIFRGNYVQGSSGGAVYSGASGSVLLLGGATFDGNYATGNGGAIYIGSLSQMEGVNRFVNNHAGSAGGAIYLTAPTTDRRSITIEDATFSGNYANAGGAIGIVGADVTLTDCTFSGNEARSTSGGAIYVNRLTDGNVGADVVISGGSFSQNSANTEGGAIFGDLNCDIAVTSASFTENTATTSGGAISVHGAESLALTGVTATENSAGTSGGAIYASYRTVTDNTDPENPVSTAVDSTTTITNCTLTDNAAGDLGGAITAYAGNSGASFFTMSGTSISGSTAGNHGGALCVYVGAATLNNNTFSGNTTAKNGGAIYGGSSATVTGSGNTFTNNSSTNTQLGGGAIYVTGSTVTLSGSTFTGNSTTANGGAVAAFSSSTVTLTDTVAQSNTAGNYGGFACAYNSTLTLNAAAGHRNTLGSLSDDTLGNSAGAGGAIFADTGATVNVANADIGYNSSVNSGGALYFNTASGTISGCTISNNSNGSAGGDAYGGAMMVGYGSNVTVTGSSFSENTSTKYAGAIYVRRKDASGENQSVPSTLALTNTSFTSNSGSDGGAIYANYECSVTGTGCTFTSNSATGAGGAINAQNDATITLSGTTLRQNTAGTTGGAIMINTGATLTTTNNCLFDQNSSTGIGGAIYFNNANGNLTDTDFTANSVGANGWYGGAIYTNSASELYVTRCEFTGNENLTGGGGAICARGNGVMSIADSSFTNNRAKTYGGAVWVFETVTATITDTDFTGNSITSTSTTVTNGSYAAEGGAIMIGKDASDGASLTVSGGTFSENSGVTGGAIGVKSGTALTVNSSTVGGTTFSENTAAGGGGGAIFAEANATVTLSDATFDQNSTTGSGGAMYAKEGVAATITDTDFTSNTSGNGGALILFGANATVSGGEFTGNNGGSGFGGAIYLRQGGSSETGTLEVTATEFNTNVATTGAAIYVNANSTLTATNATFTGNGSATDTNDGGAIFVTSTGSIDLTGGSFTSNTAKNSGGAIYLNTTATATLDSVAFTGNTCGLYGGAMYMNGTTQATVTDCTFTQNTNPTSYGGAIQIRGTGSTLTISGSTFDRNSAKYGGAIGSFETVTMTISDTTFTGNTATTSAGAIMAGRAVTNNVTSNVTLSLDGCSFTQNSVTNGNGGAVFLYGTGSLNANDTDFISNTSSGTGGAIYAYLDGNNENATLTDCALTSNSAGGNGGAIYLSAGSKMSWTGVTVTGNSSSGNGNAIYVTNGSGKTTQLNIISATFDQSSACIFIGNSGTSVVVHKPGITDVNHSPVDYSLIITGSSNYATTKVTYEET